MGKLQNGVLAVALTVAAAAAVPAQAQVTFNSTAYFNDAATVIFTAFTVSVGGTFSLYTTGGAPIDPMIHLYSGYATTGAGLGALIAMDDDSGSPSGSWYNSVITTGLAAGSYTMAWSMFSLSEAEARAGYNADGAYCGPAETSACQYDIHITSGDGAARDFYTTGGPGSATVPEPMTMVLMGSGLVGIGLARRRRREVAKNI